MKQFLYFDLEDSPNQYGMYPACLNLEIDTKGVKFIPYLCFHIELVVVPGQGFYLRCNYYDKRFSDKLSKYRLKKYTHSTSNVLVRYGYNVIFERVCTYGKYWFFSEKFSFLVCITVFRFLGAGLYPF